MTPTPVPDPVSQTRERVRLPSSLETVAFWGSVVLPAAYLPLLVGGIQPTETHLFAGLLATHVACLVLGHGHGVDS